MASPAISGSINTQGSTASATPVVDLPSAPAADDLMLVIIRSAGAGAIGWPTGWTELTENSADASDDVTAIGYRYCDGTEGYTSITLSSGNNKFAAVCWRITGAANAAPEITTAATGTSTAPDPPSITPSGGSKDYLFMALFGIEGEQTTASTTFPTNYADGTRNAGSGTAGAVTTNSRAGGAARQLTTGSAENPSAFGVDVSDDWTAWTLCISPAPPGAQTVVANRITPTVTVHNPTVVPPPQTVVAQRITPTLTIHNPVVTTPLTFTENFEGGSDETNIATTNTAFDAVSGTNAGNTAKFDSAEAAQGSLSYRLQTDATGSAVYLERIHVSKTTLYGRLYYFFDPAGGFDMDTTLVRGRDAANLQTFRIHGDTDHSLYIFDSSSTRRGQTDGSAPQNVTYIVPNRKWIRLEWKYEANAGTNGVVTLRIYDNPNAAVGSYTVELVSSAADFGDEDSRHRFGLANPDTLKRYWMDAIELSSIDWIGPVSGGIQYVAPNRITPTVTVRNPTITSGVFVSMNALNVAATVHNPAVVGAAQTVSMEAIGGAGGGPETLAITNLDSGGDNVDRTSYPTASVAPAANRTLILFSTSSIGAGVTPDVSVSGLGLTWTKITEDLFSSTGVRRITMHMAKTGGSAPTPGAVTMTMVDAGNGTTSTGCQWCLLEVEGTDDSDAVSAQIGTPVVADATGTSQTVTLATPVDSGSSRTLYAAMHRAQEAHTPEAGYTELADHSFGTPASGFSVAWDADSWDATPSVSWTTSAASAIIGVELIAGAGGAPSNVTVHNPDVFPVLVAVPNLITAAATVRNPTVLPGAVNVVMNALSVAATVRNPDVSSVQFVVPNVITAAATVRNPAVEQYVAPNRITPTVTVHNPTVTQIVQPNLITAAATVRNPTIVPGAVTVVMNALAVTATVSPPSVQQFVAAQRITPTTTVHQPTVIAIVQPNLISSAVTVHNPTVLPGAVNVVPNLITATATVRNPTVAPGAVTVVAQLITVTSTVHNPSVSQFVAPQLITAVANVRQPTVLQFVVPPVIASAVTVHQPSVVAGVATVSPQLISTPATVRAPDVQQTVQPQLLTAAVTVRQPAIVAVVQPNLISTAVTVHNPTITATNAVVMNALSVAVTAHNPTVLPGAVNVAMNALSVAATAHNPTVAAGVTTVAMNALTVAATVRNPAVEQYVAMQRITPTVTLHQPTVSAVVQPNLISVASTVRNPTVIPGAVNVVPNLITATATVHQPTILPGAVTVVAQLITSAVTVHQPAVVKVVQPQLITVAASVHQPAVLQFVAVQRIVSTVTLHQPTVGTFTNVAMQSITVAATVHNPTVLPGAVTVAMNALSVSATAHAPAIGGYVAPDRIIAGVTVHAASVVQIVSVSPISVPAIAHAPAVTQVVQPPVISTPATVRTPTITVGAVNVVMNALTVAATAHNPAVVAGAAIVAMNPLSVPATAHNPAVAVGVSVVVPNTIVAAATAHAPSVAVGVSVVVPTAMTVPYTVHHPSISTESLVQLPSLAAPVTTYSPAVVTGVALISPDHIVVTVTLHLPVVSGGISIIYLEAQFSMTIPLTASYSQIIYGVAQWMNTVRGQAQYSPTVEGTAQFDPSISP